MIGDAEWSEERWHLIRSGDCRWGRWRYIPAESSVGVQMDDDSDELYDFELSRCDDDAKIGNWLVHLSAKDWIRKEDLSDLVDMLTDLYAADVFTLKVPRRTPGKCCAWWCLNKVPDGGTLCREHDR